MRHLWLVAIMGSVSGVIGATPASWLDSPVPSSLIIAHPGERDTCDFWRTIEQFARGARVRVGLENARGCHPGGWGLDAGVNALDLEGESLRGASDRLVALRPEFAWREIDGVIVFRPVDAWPRSDHPLHRAVAPFAVAGAHPHLALHAVMAAAQPSLAHPHVDLQWSSLGRRRTDPAATGRIDDPIDVQFRGGSLLDGLNAVTEPFGGIWQVGYTGRFMHVQVQTLDFHEGTTLIVAPLAEDGPRP